jgi:glycerol-3-phosphate acyltransferase PlsY
MPWYAFFAMPLGYLLGAIPTSYIVARVRGVDLRTEGDGKISAAAVYRRLSILPYLFVVFMDIGKGLLAIFIARLLTDSQTIWLVTGMATAVGHDWSVFLKFKGGMGATVMAGILGGLVFWPWFLIGLLAGGVTMLIMRRSGVSSVVIILVTSIALFVWPTDYSRLVGIFPLCLGLLMLVKGFQKNRSAHIFTTAL